MIWKGFLYAYTYSIIISTDGNIKNFQKAQENKIEVISPGWLDECLDHRSFRDFSNYKVQLKEETFEEPGFTWLNKVCYIAFSTS